MRVVLKFCILAFVWSISWLVPNAYAEDSFKETLLNYHQKNYQEIVYLHLDKNHYFAGDFVRFKVYCLEKSTSKPTQLSKVAYVEFLDAENNPVAQARIELEGGSGFGEVYLPTSIPSENYVVRAYTQWMRNFGAESFYHTATTIINPFRKLGLDKKPESTSSTISFFPEGGILLDQVQSKVVFHGKDGNGYPIDFQARLMGNDSLEINKFEPIKNGLGSFSFIPEKETKYHVEVIHQNGDTTMHPFIEVENSGITLSIDRKRNTAEFQIKDSEVSGAIELIDILVMQNGQFLDHQQLFGAKSKHTFALQLEGMQPGVAVIYLIGDGNLICARSIYKSAEPQQSILELERKTFGTRQEVIGALSSLIDQDSFDISLSVSSFNPGLDQGQADFLNSALIQGHLKYVHNINSYFDDDVNLEEELINDLLIAYSRSIQIQNADKFLPEFRSPLVTGRIYDKETNAPINSWANGSSISRL